MQDLPGSLRTFLAAALLALPASSQAVAQGKLDARYVVTLGGLPIGKGAWVIDINDDQFTAAASGATTGLLNVLSRGRGSGAVRGPVVGGMPVASTFAASIAENKKTEEIRMVFASGVVKKIDVSPPVPPNPERVPVTDAHLRGVLDPISSTLFKVPGRANMLGPSACPSVIPVFDGRMRFDVRLAYKRMDHAKAERGYDGPAVVCAAYFNPIAGHVPTRSVIKYLIARRDIEVAVVPLAGTRIMVPFRVSIPTPLGAGVLQATQFVMGTSSPRPASSRTQ